MTELLALPDIEQAIITHLAGVFPDVRVASEVPSPRPAQLLTVSLSGSNTPNLVQRSPMLIVQGWAGSKADAFDLTRKAQAHVWALPGTTVEGVWVSHVEDGGGPVWLPDPDTRTPRYQFLAALRVGVDVL